MSVFLTGSYVCYITMFYDTYSFVVLCPSFSCPPLHFCCLVFVSRCWFSSSNCFFFGTIITMYCIATYNYNRLLQARWKFTFRLNLMRTYRYLCLNQSQFIFQTSFFMNSGKVYSPGCRRYRVSEVFIESSLS